MRLITQPNSWSCALASTAMLLDCSIRELITAIGHDGSEIIHPKLNDPASRKGTHLQEIIDVCLQFGVALTPIEARPVQTPDGVNEFEIKFPESRFLTHLANNSGLITGMARKYYHTVAWDGSKIYDPNGFIYDFDDIKINVQCFWKSNQFGKNS